MRWHEAIKAELDIARMPESGMCAPHANPRHTNHAVATN
jgi:hypothetical protein